MATREQLTQTLDRTRADLERHLTLLRAAATGAHHSTIRDAALALAEVRALEAALRSD